MNDRQFQDPITGALCECHGHRARCNFGRPHLWTTWYENGQLMRTTDTFKCVDCGGVCIGDESSLHDRIRELADCDGWEPMRAELLAVLDGECGYGHCYCGGCVL